MGSNNCTTRPFRAISRRERDPEMTWGVKAKRDVPSPRSQRSGEKMTLMLAGVESGGDRRDESALCRINEKGYSSTGGWVLQNSHYVIDPQWSSSSAALASMLAASVGLSVSMRAATLASIRADVAGQGSSLQHE
jgi:hypothetical protein